MASRSPRGPATGCAGPGRRRGGRWLMRGSPRSWPGSASPMRGAGASRSEPSRVSCILPKLGRMSRSCRSSTTRRPRPGRSGWCASTLVTTRRSTRRSPAVARRLGMTAETLRKWIRQAEIDEGQAPGVTSEAAMEIRELRRKNRELEQTIEILKAATSFFARFYYLLHAEDLLSHRRARRGPFRGLLSDPPGWAKHGIKIAPRTYWARRSRPPSRRALADARNSPRSWPGSASPMRGAGASRSPCMAA